MLATLAPVAAIFAGGLLNLLIVLIVAGLIAAIAYYVLSLFLPHPIPALVAAVIIVIALIDALSGLG